MELFLRYNYPQFELYLYVKVESGLKFCQWFPYSLICRFVSYSISDKQDFVGTHEDAVSWWKGHFCWHHGTGILPFLVIVHFLLWSHFSMSEMDDYCLLPFWSWDILRHLPLLQKEAPSSSQFCVRLSPTLAVVNNMVWYCPFVDKYRKSMFLDTLPA